MADEKNIFEQIRDNVLGLTEAIEQVTCLDPAIDSVEKLTPRKRRLAKKDKRATTKGIYNASLVEATPARITTSAEKEIREGNSWIVLGRDRPSGVKTGYGALGHHRASAIDICVGPQGRDIAEWDKKNREKISINPDYEKDSARIYISAKTDVDTNFNLAPGQVGDAKAKSAIAIKADGVRIIGREGVKIITRGGDTKNSRGCVKWNFSWIYEQPNEI